MNPLEIHLLRSDPLINIKMTGVKYIKISLKLSAYSIFSVFIYIYVSVFNRYIFSRTMICELFFKILLFEIKKVIQKDNIFFLDT